MAETTTKHTRKEPEKGTILLLQGPMGPFFCRVARQLRKAGWRVLKINFNAGDQLFYPVDAIPFRGTLREWPDFLATKLKEERVERIFLFGDCRPLHAAAVKVARSLKVKVTVFEEGYLRPNYITVESGGVNGNSPLPRHSGFYRTFAGRGRNAEAGERRYPHAFSLMALYSILYVLACSCAAFLFPRYQHHKDFHPLAEGKAWLRSFLRRCFYLPAERRLAGRLPGELHKKYFFVPLQVYNDAQVHHHSDLGLDRFVLNVIRSFARHAPPGTRLLFKQHPMDRGHVDHEPFVRRVAAGFGVGDRVDYTRDCHLPTALRHACGTIVINSTVGLQSLHHNIPVKVLGRAVYNLPGLVSDAPLRSFWRTPGEVDATLYLAFRHYLLKTCQFNASFSAVPDPLSVLRWAGGRRPDIQIEKAGSLPSTAGENSIDFLPQAR